MSEDRLPRYGKRGHTEELHEAEKHLQLCLVLALCAAMEGDLDRVAAMCEEAVILVGHCRRQGVLGSSGRTFARE